MPEENKIFLSSYQANFNFIKCTDPVAIFFVSSMSRRFKIVSQLHVPEHFERAIFSEYKTTILKCSGKCLFSINFDIH